jgi:hypothetical protein
LKKEIQIKQFQAGLVEVLSRGIDFVFPNKAPHAIFTMGSFLLILLN